ncbi:MAG TPA: GNAT family N-acetyltransferase, partial [Thermoplasmata archaeon]|nr:GNAT family N-acetyltransferase [Thermoplasmata archaeon]
VFRRLIKPEELRAAEELQRSGPVGADEAAVPVPVLRTMQDQGGLVLGAFTDIYLAGTSVGFLGWDGQGLYHYLQRFVVRPEYRNHGLGRRLTAFVRDEARQQGLDAIRGTFDPLSSSSAFFAVHRLGATPERYLTHYYGQQGGDGTVDHESDRLRWVWPLTDPALDERLARPTAPGAAPDPRFTGAPSLLETEVADSGLRLPSAVSEPSTPFAQLEIPFDIDLIRQHEPAGIRRWRHAVRDAFRACFDLGYRVVDFDVLRTEHERRAVYLVQAPSTAPVPPAPAPTPPG